MNCRYLLFEMPGPGVRWLLAIVLLIGSSGIAAGCGPVTAAHTLEVLPKTLPPTWTEVPPSAISDTILEADITPSPTLGLATPIPPSPTSGPAVPFKYLYMFDSQRAWAWGWEEDITFLWRTDDGGSTWNEVTPVGIQRLVFALNADTVWVVTCQYAYEKCVLQSTDDGGKTWTELTKDEALLFNTQFTFFNPELGLIRNSDVAAGSAYIRFYQTFDGGMTWDKVQLASLPKGITKGLMDEFIICNCGDVLYIDLEQVIHIPGNLVKDPERECHAFHHHVWWEKLL
jgi:hypothetical protein